MSVFLRFAARRSDCLKIFLTRQQPLGMPFLKRAASDVTSRSFSQTRANPQAPSLSPSSNLRKQNLPDDVMSFLNELENYANDSAAGIGDTKLIKHIKKYRDDSETLHVLLLKSLEFEAKHPECRGLVDGDSFFYTVQSCVNHDRLEVADELLTFHRAFTYIELSPKCYGFVMSGYAKRRTPEALKKIEEMLSTLEEDRLRCSELETTPLTPTRYNILMNAYVVVLGKQSISPVKMTIERMQNFSERVKDDTLRPNLASYTTLMKAFILRRQPGFALEVNDILDQLKADRYYLEQPARDRFYVECLTIDAWSKSGTPQAPKRAKEIFDANYAAQYYCIQLTVEHLRCNWKH
jgi:hypothetical protein